MKSGGRCSSEEGGRGGSCGGAVGTTGTACSSHGCGDVIDKLKLM